MKKVIAILCFVIAAALISWWLATGAYSSAHDSRRLATAGVLVIALIKGRLVIRTFMEVDRAPPALRFATDAWLLALGAALLTLYL